MKMLWKRVPSVIAVVAAMAMVAVACGGTETVTVTEEVVVTSIVTEVVTEEVVVTETETVTEEVVVTSIVTETVTEEVVVTEREVVTETVEVMVDDAGMSRTLRIAIPHDVEFLDPARGSAQLTNLVLKNVYMQPVQYRPGPDVGGFSYADTTSFEGQWIESWDFSDDFQTITLRLRQGLTFPTSGNPVTADDAIYTINRALATGPSGPAWVWGNIGVTSIDQIERVDDRTLVVHDARPSTIVLPLMRDQTMGIMDSVTIQANSTEDDEWGQEWLNQNYAGNGRYVVDSWDRGSRMVLTRNPTWTGFQPFFQTVVLLTVPEPANRLALLQSGDVDIALDLSVQQLQSAAASDGVKVLSVPDRNGINVLMNNQAPPFDNVTLRKAMAYAVDYNAIVNGVLNGQAVPSQGPISVNSRFFDLYNLEDAWLYEHDPDRARELMAEAGFPDGFSFEMIIRPNIPLDEAIATNLKAQFSDYGIDMSIRPVTDMNPRLFALDYQMAFRGGLLDYVDDPYYQFFLWWDSQDAAINWTGFVDPRVDEILDETAAVVSDPGRREPYREAVTRLVEAAPMLWLANANYTLAMREDIGGFTLHPDGLLWFATLNRSG